MQFATSPTTPGAPTPGLPTSTRAPRTRPRPSPRHAYLLLRLAARHLALLADQHTETRPAPGHSKHCANRSTNHQLDTGLLSGQTTVVPPGRPAPAGLEPSGRGKSLPGFIQALGTAGHPGCGPDGRPERHPPWTIRALPRRIATPCCAQQRPEGSIEELSSPIERRRENLQPARAQPGGHHRCVSGSTITGRAKTPAGDRRHLPLRIDAVPGEDHLAAPSRRRA